MSVSITTSGRLSVSSGSVVRTNLKTTIRNIDWRFDTKIQTASATMMWRMSPGGITYVGLQILPTSLKVFTVVSGARTDYHEETIANNNGWTYSFRVVNAGTTVVVYRNEGDYTNTGTITPPVELFRVPGVVGVTDPGHVGVTAAGAAIETDNWVVRPGTTPPPLVWTPTAGLPAVVTNPQPIPPGWPPAEGLLVGRIKEMKLVETGYADLLLWPTPALFHGYGGVFPQEYDLGEPTYKEFVEDLATVSGVRDYTYLHGAKAITMTLAVVPGLIPGQENVTVNYLTDLVARWCAPHRRPSLLYTPHDGPQRFIELNPTPLGRPVTVSQHQDFTILSLSFKAPRGIEEDVTPKTAEISAADFEPTSVVTLGTKASLPVIKIFGPSTNPIIYNDTLDFGGNARLGLDATIASGQYVELDARNKTVRFMGSEDPGANMRQDLNVRGWFPLTPFENFIRMEDDDATGTAILEYRDSW